MARGKSYRWTRRPRRTVRRFGGDSPRSSTTMTNHPRAVAATFDTTYAATFRVVVGRDMGAIVKAETVQRPARARKSFMVVVKIGLSETMSSSHTEKNETSARHSGGRILALSRVWWEEESAYQRRMDGKTENRKIRSKNPTHVPTHCSVALSIVPTCPQRLRV